MTLRQTRHRDPVLNTRLDLNLLHPELRRQKPTVLTVRPWIILALYTLLLVPTVFLLQLGQTTLNHIEINLESSQAQLDSFSAVSDERRELKRRLEEAKLQADQVEGAYRRIGFAPQTYSETLYTILGSVPYGSELTGIGQEGATIYLVGNADTHLLPVTFVETLRATGLFKSVNLESLKRERALGATEASGAGQIEVRRYRFEIAMEMATVPEGP